MKRYLTLAASAAIFAALPLAAQTTAETKKKEYPSPPEIVAKAKAEEWVAIAPADLMVMDLAPDAKGKARRVVIQLMPPPFSQGWVGNVRAFFVRPAGGADICNIPVPVRRSTGSR